MRIALIVLNWNGKQDTLACLHSLQALNYLSYQVIVVDNGSTDDSVVAIRSTYPNVTLIETHTNLGFAGGNNRGIKYALEQDFEGILLLNNDTIAHPQLLTAFVSTLQKHPHSILGAKAYLYSKQDCFDHFGGRWNPLQGKFDLVGYREKEDHASWETPFAVDYVCGCALFGAAEAFKTIGLLDERFFLFWEETDFCYRAKQHGYSILIAPQAKIWHKVSASFVGGKPHITYFWWRNRFLWMQKNLGVKERQMIYKQVITPEISKLIRHYLLFSLRLIFSRSSERYLNYKEKQLQIKAALQGTLHYFLKRFYNGPSWIYSPQGEKKPHNKN